MSNEDSAPQASRTSPQPQPSQPRPAPATEQARVSYPQDQEWNVAPIECLFIANSAPDADKGDILALTDQPKKG